MFRDGKASAIEKMLPVYDNLSRALEQETTDAAYKKGVEMTMTGLVEIVTRNWTSPSTERRAISLIPISTMQ